MSRYFTQVDQFKNEMQILGRDFICHTILPTSSASVEFLGLFQGQTVLWNMTLATLSHWQRKDSGNDSIADSEIFYRSFIEIAEGKEGVFQIRVGLGLELIDEPTIRKTIIMICNYKRLAVGRSGFGSIQT